MDELPARSFVFMTATLAVVWLVMLTFGTGAVDRTILLMVYAGERPWLGPISLWLTYLGSWRMLAAVVAAAAMWLIFNRQYRDALVITIAAASGRALVLFQKTDLGRPRPDESLHLIDVQSMGFPSGHAANAMIVWLLAALLVTPKGNARACAVSAAVLLSLLVGLSRVMLGVHWPSDVVAGWSFGLLWALTCAQAATKLEPELQRVSRRG